MGNRKSVDGNARKIILSIKPSLDDEIVIQRFSKVCGLLRDPVLARRAFVEFGKDDVLTRAQQSQLTHV